MAGGSDSSGDYVQYRAGSGAPASSSPGASSPADPAAPAPGGFFNRPGLLGGLAAGFLGAGLIGLLFGNGLLGGLGGITSFLGLLLQIGIIALGGKSNSKF